MNSIVSEKRYIANKLGVPYESLSQSYLRAESLLGTQSVVDFTLQTNKVLNPTVTERLLDLNDEFVITHFRVSLKQLDVTNTEVAEDILQLRQQLTTFAYNDPAGFNATLATSQMYPIGALYNGDLNFTIDRTEFIPQFPMRAFYRVGNILGSDIPNQGTAFLSQKVGVPTTNIATTQGGSYDSQTETSLYGFYPSEPTKIDGRQTIDLSINLGANVPMGATEVADSNYAVFEARGYLITNAND